MAAAFALLGPTASGKSRLALDLARRYPVEIVSMDSAQVYRGMDIGTAKPSRAERAGVPHHLIDLVDPDEPYSAGRWREACLEAVSGISARSRIPLIVGGTMLYYRSLVAGLDDLPAAHPGIRARLDAQAARSGWPAMHAELAKIDPASAKRIAANDSQRIQRALEVFQLTGRPLSSLQRGSRSDLPFALQAFSVAPERSALHKAIEGRFDAMLAAGLVDEVKALRLKFNLNEKMPSMRAVGYRQVWDFLEGRTDERRMREAAITATRQLAKRQLTWLRSFEGLRGAEHLESALQQGS